MMRKKTLSNADPFLSSFSEFRVKEGSCLFAEFLMRNFILVTDCSYIIKSGHLESIYWDETGDIIRFICNLGAILIAFKVKCSLYVIILYYHELNG